jgi:hypothetical protein
MKTLYMRIGADKAGTVSLAKLVIKNRDVFLKCGVYAPLRNCMPVYEYFIKKNRLISIDTFDSSRFLSKPGHQKKFQELMNNYERYKDFDIFLTTETFWGRLSKKDATAKRKRDIIALCDLIKRYFKHHQIKIILNVRRIDTYIESLYKQEIKAGRFLGIPYLKKHLTSQKCYDLLLLLEDQFGKENITIRPFERSQMIDGDLVADTLSLMNLYDHIHDFDINIENEGIHRDLCETLIILNKKCGKLLRNNDLLVLSSRLKKEYKFPDIKYILSLAERKELFEKFGPFYQYLAENYNDRKPFFIDPFPDDSHLNYSLTKDRFEMIQNLIFNKKKYETGLKLKFR